MAKEEVIRSSEGNREGNDSRSACAELSTRYRGPNDVDIVITMDDDFDVSVLKGEIALPFDHVVAQTVFGASVFWVRY